MRTAEKIEKLIKQFFETQKTSAVMPIEKDEQVINEALAAFEKHKTQSAISQPSVWRIIMKSSITKFAVAAVIIIAASLGITFLNKSTPVAYANQILEEAIKAVSDLTSVHMKARMRTLPNDNFGHLDLERDFASIEMWKRTEPNGLVQWRVEKPGRVLLVDGTSTLMLIRPNYGVLEKTPYPPGCFDSWFSLLMDVRKLLDDELKNAKSNIDREALLRHENVNGSDKTILEVEHKANVPENDYLRNKFIFDSDHLKVYQFDSETKLLESFQIYVHKDSKDILVFEITNIEYNQPILDSVFKLDLPENMIWHEEPKVLPDNEKYQKMSPKETTQAFFEACSKEDWVEFLKFWSSTAVDEGLKSYLGGLEIISIGKPFQSKGYGGWFVPYEIKLKDGSIKKRNLAIRNDNPAKRWVVDGGI